MIFNVPASGTDPDASLNITKTAYPDLHYATVNAVYSANTGGSVRASYTKSGEINVYATEVVDGTLPIGADGVYDVTNYESVNVSVGGGGGGVATAAVTLGYSYVYYTDANMNPVSSTGSVTNVLMPIGSIVVGRGVTDPSITPSGVTQIASWGSRTTAAAVYKVTG